MAISKKYHVIFAISIPHNCKGSIYCKMTEILRNRKKTILKASIAIFYPKMFVRKESLGLTTTAFQKCKNGSRKLCHCYRHNDTDESQKLKRKKQSRTYY